MRRFFSIALALFYCMSAPLPSLAGLMPNLNTATAEEIMAAIPSISPELAEKIIQAREDFGDFVSEDDLKNIEGIDQEIIRAIMKRYKIADVAVFGNSC